MALDQATRTLIGIRGEGGTTDPSSMGLIQARRSVHDRRFEHGNPPDMHSISQIEAPGPDGPVRITVHRPAMATWYGPGLYGHRTACGQVLSHAIMGVAHRTLPCGTPVEIAFNGQTVTVPVIDRGPFTNGARYDLTSATAQALGVTETSTIGVAPRRGETMEPPLAAPPPYAGTGGVVPTSP